ncbi:hypothetical protein [Roseomonas xinghualingensis]|uniref:hypothetical protein n=1 Tax=Roseomonas xinghualingensis TaxID=2986475 RepID=UPI0021F1402E|nr:hypothetical protein [Roseomonas sp. SXEYE001]MCV4209612.1 hypothetical protein [Roseomonas sp. SXEYE001]
MRAMACFAVDPGEAFALDIAEGILRTKFPEVYRGMDEPSLIKVSARLVRKNPALIDEGRRRREGMESVSRTRLDRLPSDGPELRV